MKTHIDYQTIDYQGNPAFVLIPWDDFKRLRPLLDGDKIPPLVYLKRLSKHISYGQYL